MTDNHQPHVHLIAEPAPGHPWPCCLLLLALLAILLGMLCLGTGVSFGQSPGFG